MITPLLELEGITKVYGNGVVANRNIDFSLEEGEIHAVCGENGAGKTTLMKILYGLEQPSRGRIRVRGKEVRLASPRGAMALGIGMVHQHFMLVPSFTAAENLFLGEEPRKLGLFVDASRARAEAGEIARKYGLPIDPAAKVADISVGMRQKLEILKALHRGASILILDEPTAVLTPQESEELFVELRQLKASGHTIIFISHKLKEVMAISDRVTVIKRGETLGTFAVGEVTETELSRLMVGRDVAVAFGKDGKSPGEERLRVEDLHCPSSSGRGAPRGIGFSVRSGEIVGVAGVEGNGQRELVDALTGNLAPRRGRIVIEGEEVVGPSSRNRYSIGTARGKGLAYIPEDRIAVGSAMEGSLEENLVASRLRDAAFSSGPFLLGKAVASYASAAIEDYQIVASGSRQKLAMLSGGNVQKVVVARECSGSPRILIAEQPTRGVDVGAAEVIHRHLLDMKAAGAAILLVSADINEALELSDRLLVFFEGEIVARIDRPSELSEEDLGLYMLGLKRQGAAEKEGAAS